MTTHKIKLLILLFIFLLQTPYALAKDKDIIEYLVYLQNNSSQAIQLVIIGTDNLAKAPAAGHVYDIPAHMAKPLQFATQGAAIGHVHFSINNGNQCVMRFKSDPLHQKESKPMPRFPSKTPMIRPISKKEEHTFRLLEFKNCHGQLKGLNHLTSKTQISIVQLFNAE